VNTVALPEGAGRGAEETLTTMSDIHYPFYLIVDEPGTAGAGGPRRLGVPGGVSYLQAGASGPPRLLAKAPAKGEPACALEAVGGARPQLLLLSPGDARVRVNGQPAPPVALLGVKDQVQLGGGPLLHVTAYHAARVGPTPADQVGRECPVCRAPLAATTVYVCPGCGTALHCEVEDKGPDRLECARLTSECPTCRAPVVLEAGWAYLPELADG
jgi:hypothetical protein